MIEASTRCPLKLKVCGMREGGNILNVSRLSPAYIGFIFYDASPRFAGNLDPEVLRRLPVSIKKTGVFVNASLDDIRKKIELFQLNAVQLHGSETPEFCRQVKEQGAELIKAFGIDESFDFASLIEYEEQTDYFLFDTKTKGHGGSGKIFDWKLLAENPSSKPYFLSGGIDSSSIKTIQVLNDTRLYALDLNSRFEIEPGLKDIEKLSTFFNHINNNAGNALTEDI